MQTRSSAVQFLIRVYAHFAALLSTEKRALCVSVCVCVCVCVNMSVWQVLFHYTYIYRCDSPQCLWHQ